MGIQKAREEFEKLPEIARRLKSSNTIKYIESDNSYSSPEWDSLTCCNEDFINPAWYAFQEQQKIIDLLRKQAKCHHTWHGKSENQYCGQCGLT